MWLNIPDYDAPTQMVKPAERNTNYVDMVMTIPKVQPHPPLLASGLVGQVTPLPPLPVFLLPPLP